MDRSFLKAGFYETYYFAFCVRNILNDQSAYLRLLDDFYGDARHLSFINPFPRFSAFHCFLDFTIGTMLTDNTENCDLDILQDQFDQFKQAPKLIISPQFDVLPIEHALNFYKIPHISFTKWLAENGKVFLDAMPDDLEEYLVELSEDSAIEALQDQVVRETFYLLFANRHLLLLFNQMMADQISKTQVAEIGLRDAKRFAKNGVLRRVPIPKWVKRPVFYRDRGLCGNCGKDLSGTVSIWSEGHYDHIVPLAKGGLNDVTNIQLLCGDCNREKSDKEAKTSSTYEDWYPLE